MARIMIVDDTPFIRKMLGDILVGQGHEISYEASNGREAVEAYRRVKPDIVMMDICMPEMDGISALKLILQQDPSAKVVMCSTFGQQSFILETIRLGAKDFIVKPFTPYKVIEVIEHTMNRLK